MKYRTITRLLASGFLAFSLSSFSAYADSTHDHNEAWRLFVADHSKPIVHVIDYATGQEIAQYQTKGYATLTTSTSGQTVFASQPDFDAVHVIKTGITFSDHGDHRDLDVSEPALLPLVIEGKQPFHVVPHGDHAIVFFDREGKARIYKEKTLLDGKLEAKIVDTTPPHHGVVVTMGRFILASAPSTEPQSDPEKLPPRIGLRIFDENNRQQGNIHTCSNLHGEALSGNMVAFGCKEGVLIVRPNGNDVPQVQMLSYPQNFPEGSVGALLGGKTMQFFLGNYGAKDVVLIDPDNKEQPYRLIELPTRRVDFVLDPANIQNAYILTEDGNLHVLDVLNGKILRSNRVTEPYSKDGHWRDPRPRLAVVDGEIALTDPRHALIRIIDPQTLKETRTITVGDQPFSVVAVGGSGAAH